MKRLFSWLTICLDRPFLKARQAIARKRRTKIQKRSIGETIMKAQILDLLNQVVALVSALPEPGDEVAQLQAQIVALQSSVSALEGQVSSLQSQVDAAQAKLAQIRALLDA
jgi:hypothetical protein